MLLTTAEINELDAQQALCVPLLPLPSPPALSTTVLVFPPYCTCLPSLLYLSSLPPAYLWSAAVLVFPPPGLPVHRYRTLCACATAVVMSYLSH